MKSGLKSYLWILAGTLFLAGAALGNGPGPDKALSLSETEQYVTNMVAMGVEADLSTNVTAEESNALTQVDAFRRQFADLTQLARFKGRFRNETARALSSEFLETLLTTTNYLVDRHGVRIAGGILTNDVDLQFVTESEETRLVDCRFKGDVDCSRSVFGRSLSFSRSVFEKEAVFNGLQTGFDLLFTGATFFDSANFNGARAARDASFRDAVFNQGAQFTGASIGGQFRADRVQFSSTTQTAVFNGVTVGEVALMGQAMFMGPVDFRYTSFGQLRLTNARFAGGADFTEARVNGDCLANGAQFLNDTQGVNFVRMKIGGLASFNSAGFAGPLSFSEAQIGGWLDAYGITCSNPGTTNKFQSLTVGGDAVLSKSVFDGPVDFLMASVGRDLDLEEVQFNQHSSEVGLRGIQVNGALYLDGSDFARAVDLSRATAAYLDADAAQFADSSGTNDFTDMKVAGAASFCSTDFAGPLKLGGMQFQDLDAGDNSLECTQLVALLRKAEYADDLYETAEDALSREGNPHLADQVYIEQRLREAGTLKWYRQPWSYFLWFTVGYGRRPWLAWVYSLGVILFGCRVFRDSQTGDKNASLERMEPQDSASPDRYYEAFWYSLDVFVPGIDFGMATFWKPKENNTFARRYLPFHRILGWILVPIGLLAVTGLIK